MGIAINKLFAQLLFWIYDMLDTIFGLFGILSGLKSVEIGDSRKSLIEIFLEQDTVIRAFLLLVLVGVCVAGISIIVAVVKNIINMKGGERKPHARVVGQGLGAIATSLVMAIVMIVGIGMSNTVLGLVNKATTGGEETTLSVQLFNMCVGESYEYDYNNPQKVMVVKIDEFGNKVLDENGKEIFIQKVDGEGRPVYKYPIIGLKSGWWNEENKSIASAVVEGWDTVTPDKIFGVHEGFIFENKNAKYEIYPIVEMESFNLFLAYLSAIIILVSIIWAMLALVKRTYDLVLLFIALPLVAGTIPTDDGARFKQWRDTVISKVVLVYGVVLSVNLFILLGGIINNLELADIDIAVANLFKVFMVIGGALAINGGQLLIARLFGASAEEGREMAHAARAAFGGLMAAGGALRGAKNLAFGGQNKYGRQVGGILPGAAKFGIGATNLLGNALGGAKYQQFANNAKARSANMIGRLRGATHTGTATARQQERMNNTDSAGNYIPQAWGGNSQGGKAHNGLIGLITRNRGNQGGASANTDNAQAGFTGQQTNSHQGLVGNVLPPTNNTQQSDGAYTPDNTRGE